MMQAAPGQTAFQQVVVKLVKTWCAPFTLGCLWSLYILFVKLVIEWLYLVRFCI
jgi:hypothetical protein